jgi:hypothetical protein
VELAVSDTGIGMDAATRARIFEPFFTTKEPGKGTGLGLAIVYGAVQGAGGRILVESEPFRGTTFRILLPASGEEATPAPGGGAGRDPGVGRATGTILLVEDDDAVRRLAAIHLEAEGYRVIPAGDGEEALRICRSREERIDLLLSDVVMPGPSGSELATSLAKVRPGLRILLVSGYMETEVPERTPGGTAVRFLRKPYGRAELLDEVRAALDRGPPAAGGGPRTSRSPCLAPSSS